MEWIVFSSFESTGFPLIFSIMTNSNLPPSKAGSGNKLINPTLTLSKAVKLKSDQIPELAAVPTIPNMPTGPDKAVRFKLPVTKYAMIKIIWWSKLNVLEKAY